uniref:Secreted protein n=1 Tax=Steinernema glaseri TaxID=37863 RepID=A0A1I8AIG5_9BILA
MFGYSFILLLACIGACVPLGNAVTLSEIYERIMSNDREMKSHRGAFKEDSVLSPSRSHPEYQRHREIIGSFRGIPIYNRQYSGFIDDNGVPVPVLPYARNSDLTDPWRFSG